MSKSLAEITGDTSSPFRAAINAAANSIRVAMPGIIVSFNASDQTVNVKPSLADNVNIGGQTQLVFPPIISDVPVAIPRGGNFAVTLPIKPGDNCILVFADSCIDGFWQSGKETAPAEYRQHDLSDAMAIVGISAGGAISGYNPDALEIRSLQGEATITVNDRGVTLNAGIVDINAGTVSISGGAVNIGGGPVTITGSPVDINGTIF